MGLFHRDKAEKKEKAVGKFPWGMVFAATFVVLGVLFLCFSGQTVDVACMLIGGVTVAAAIVNAALALAKRERGVKFFLKMSFCVLALVCGVVTLVSRRTALEYIVGAAAFLLVVEGSFRLKDLTGRGNVKNPLFWIALALTIACYVGEAFLIKFYNGASEGGAQWMIRLLGLVLIADGFSSVFAAVYARATEKEKPVPVAVPVPVTAGRAEKGKKEKQKAHGEESSKEVALAAAEETAGTVEKEKD